MRTDILESKEIILKFISDNKPKAEICRYFKCKPETLDSYLKKLNIDYKGNQSRKNAKKFFGKKRGNFIVSVVKKKVGEVQYVKIVPKTNIFVNVVKILIVEANFVLAVQSQNKEK